MRKIIWLGLAFAATGSLGACSAHDDNRAAPIDAADNAGGEVATDTGANADANGAADANGLEANLAAPGNEAGGINAD